MHPLLSSTPELADLNKLKSAGMYVNDELIRQSLAAIGEGE